jgi:protein-disulfide isomerase
VQADVDLGIRLGIEGTPWILLNGRHVADPSVPALAYLIGHLLERADP